MKHSALAQTLKVYNVLSMARNMGDKIKMLRETKGLSRRELARLTNKSEGMIGRIERWEDGYNNPTLNLVLSLAEALEVDPATLVTTDMDAYLKDLTSSGESLILAAKDKEFITYIEKLSSLDSQYRSELMQASLDIAERDPQILPRLRRLLNAAGWT